MRKQLKDTVGYCEGIQTAANLGDSLSYKEFWVNCGKIDTSYYTIDHKKANKRHGAYFTIKKNVSIPRLKDLKKLKKMEMFC